MPRVSSGHVVTTSLPNLHARPVPSLLLFTLPLTRVGHGVLAGAPPVMPTTAQLEHTSPLLAWVRAAALRASDVPNIPHLPKVQSSSRSATAWMASC